MSKLKTRSNITIQLLAGILILFYLCVGFVPNWQAVDKIAPQWLVLSIINSLSLTLILFNSSYFKIRISNALKSGLSIIYIGFFIWASFSYFYAINSTEVIVNLTRQANTLFMYLHLGIFIQLFKNKISLLCWTFAIILSIEVYSLLLQAYEMYQTPAGIIPGILKGVTANRNIAAFSMAIKIPFILFLVNYSKNKIFKFSLLILLLLTIFSLSIISSRASYIAVFLVTFLYAGLIFYQSYNSKSYKKLSYLLYIIVPLMLSVVFNQLVVSGSKTVSAIERASTISLNTNDGSVNQRLRYYQDVLTHMLENPILGTGLGNWKLASIDYDKEDIVGYVVPYHAHSDFIQLGAELGFIGFFLYLGVFVFAVYAVFKILTSKKINEKEKVFVFFLLIALGVYFVDANLNFPIARPQVLTSWAMIIALINFYFKNSIDKKEFSNEKLNNNYIANGFVFIGIIIFIPSVIISNKIYDSLKAQMVILQDFNSNKYSIPLNQIESFIPSIPNITVTTIPMDAIKARYFYYYKKYDKAIAYAESGRKQNPYLMYPELLLSQVNLAKGEILKSKTYAKKAFFNLPNNNLHASHYLQLLIETGDKLRFSETFDALTKNNSITQWKNYLVGASKLFPPGDPVQMKRSLEATKIFSGNNEFMQLHKLISIGSAKIQEGLEHSNIALSYFNQGQHDKAVIEFEKAIESDPLEFSYRENAATSYYLLNDLNNAIKHIDVVINEMNPLNGKCEYIKALIYLKFGDPIGACPLLQTSKDSGYSQAEGTFNQYCANI